MPLPKNHKFDLETQEIARIAKILSHPARVTILKYLANTKTCISGNISNEIPLSRTTVFQHLQELKNAGLIHGEIDGVKKNYCLCSACIKTTKKILENFLEEININVCCKNNCK